MTKPYPSMARKRPAGRHLASSKNLAFAKRAEFAKARALKANFPEGLRHLVSKK